MKYKAVKIIVETTTVKGQQLDTYKLEVENMSHREIETVCENVIRSIKEGKTNPKVEYRTDGF